MRSKGKVIRSRFPIFTVSMSIIAAVLLFIILYRVSALMTINEIILIFIYPFVLSYIIGYQSTESMEKYLDKKISELLDDNASEKIKCFPTKYSIPEPNEWWNKSFIDARSRFFIVGVTNKGWIQKDINQSKSLAEAIIRIIENNGTVKIVSENTENAINIMQSFWEQFIKEKVKSLPASRRKHITEKMKKNFFYFVYEKANYEIVISDNRMVLLITPNSIEFRSEAMVIELIEEKNPIEFKNYLADLDRTTQSCKRIILELV